MKKLTRTLAALFVAFGILLPVIQIDTAGAQASALTITPRREITVNKGDSQDGTLPVSNPRGDENLILKLKMVEFGSKNQTGAPFLNLDDNAAPEVWSLKKYITLPDEVTLKAGETTNVPFTVTIPSNLGAGSYYGAIQYLATTESGANVSIAASATTLMFVNVPGDAKQQMSLKKLGAFNGNSNDENGQFKLFYFGSQPRYISYILKNEGNVAERPNGSIILKNSFTGKVVKIDKANPNGSLALIGQERRFDACIKTGTQTQQSTTSDTQVVECQNPGLTPGRYTITLSTFYGQGNGKSLEIIGTSSFWYLPTWFVVLVVIAILAIVALVWWIVNKIKNRAAPRRR